MDIELTKESRRVLKSIYDIYCERRNDGKPKSSAVRFVDFDIDGLDAARNELSKAGLIICFITGDFDLSDKGILFMEENSEKVVQTIKIQAEQEKSLFWERAGVIVAAVVGVATILVSIILWAFS